jgi:hypothetical protein
MSNKVFIANVRSFFEQTSYIQNEKLSFTLLLLLAEPTQNTTAILTSLFMETELHY